MNANTAYGAAIVADLACAKVTGRTPIIILEETFGDLGPTGEESMTRNLEVALGHMDRADAAVEIARKSGDQLALTMAMSYREDASVCFGVAAKMRADFYEAASLNSVSP